MLCLTISLRPYRRSRASSGDPLLHQHAKRSSHGQSTRGRAPSKKSAASKKQKPSRTAGQAMLRALKGLTGTHKSVRERPQIVLLQDTFVHHLHQPVVVYAPAEHTTQRRKERDAQRRPLSAPAECHMHVHGPPRRIKRKPPPSVYDLPTPSSQQSRATYQKRPSPRRKPSPSPYSLPPTPQAPPAIIPEVNDYRNRRGGTRRHGFIGSPKGYSARARAYA